MKTPTRQDYMDNRVTFHEFYSAVVETAGIRVTQALADRTRAALAKGDEHLNTIPLETWDRLAMECQSAISRALREHGDFFSMAGGVCVMKTAAKLAAIRGGSNAPRL